MSLDGLERLRVFMISQGLQDHQARLGQAFLLPSIVVEAGSGATVPSPPCRVLKYDVDSTRSQVFLTFGTSSAVCHAHLSQGLA